MSRTGKSPYRTTVILCAFVVAGWAWDFALGGGRQHSPAWFAALVVVGGISALAARSAAKLPPDEADIEQPKPIIPVKQVKTVGIRDATAADHPALIEIETAADALFTVSGIGPLPEPATAADIAASAHILVHGEPPVGFARIDIVDGVAHLEQLSVRPKFMRRGIGTALVEATCGWAAERGVGAVTLCTFADVPWNGPFYAGLGFTEVTELTPGLAALRATEQRVGLDALGRRVVLRRELPVHGDADARG